MQIKDKIFFSVITVLLHLLCSCKDTVKSKTTMLTAEHGYMFRGSNSAIFFFPLLSGGQLFHPFGANSYIFYEDTPRLDEIK